jgi:type VI secretion system protein ImpK
MSGRDPPPSGRDKGTIVRPNPGGRRPPPPQAPAAAPAVPLPPRAVPPPPRPSGPASANVGGEEWIATPAAPPPRDFVDTAPHRRAEELFAPNENPLMRAAGPLLLLLGRLRTAQLRAQFASLAEQVAQSIQAFDKEIRQANVAAEQANTAKYILCATADDIVQNIPTEDRHVWTQYSMLSRFFGERTGGVRFFDLVEQTMKDPFGNYDLLELQHACLALGFQGVHRTSGGGVATLQTIQRNVYEALRRVRARIATDLSPRWQGQSLSLRRSGVRVPIWATAAFLALLLVGLFLVLRYLLGGGTEASAQAMLVLHPRTPVALVRVVQKQPEPEPEPKPKIIKDPCNLTQLQRIRSALAPEIAAGGVIVPCPTGPNWIVINVGDKLLFASGEATVINAFKPLAERMAQMLEKETGTIKIVGHTDDQPLSPFNPFKSNFDLSVARAKNVADLLRAGISHPERFEVEGKGADEPVDPERDDKTPEDQRKNRRVEVMVQRTD